MIESDISYDRLYYKLRILGNFSGFLIMSYIYGMNSFYIPYFCLFAILLYIVYAIFVVKNNQGFLKYSIDKWGKENRIGSIILDSVYIILLIIQFSLPADIINIIQKGLFVTAFLIPIYGIITIK